MNIEALGDLLSFWSGVALTFLGTLAMIAYRPRLESTLPEALLAAAIFIGFAAHAGNTLYWQVFGQLAVNNEWLTVDDLRFYGDFADLLFKGGGALAGYLHLRALWSGLASDEKSKWTVLEMAFYPHKMRCLRALIRRIDE